MTHHYAVLTTAFFALLSFFLPTDGEQASARLQPAAQHLSAAPSCAVCDRRADSLQLVALYNAAGGPSWHTSWDLTRSMDSWFGILLNHNGCVGVVNLSNNGLSGLMPNLVLPELQFIDLSRNALVGSVPNFPVSEILQTVDMNGNFFTGFIPVFQNKIQLRSLDLSNNLLIGSIPDLSGIPALLELDLRDNSLSGSLPAFVNNVQLREIYLSDNDISGQLPDFTLPSLTVLDLSNNHLFGTIPNLVGSNNLEFLNLSFNNFSGNLPAFPFMSKLGVLLLNDNNLFGPIPNWQTLFNLEERLWLQNNKLSGRIPNFNNMPKLQDLNLNNNLLDSLTPQTYFSNLVNLRVSNNKLTFDDLLPSRQVPSGLYEYVPQERIGRDTAIFVDLHADYTIELNIDEAVTSNIYYWYKNEVFYAQTTEPRLPILNAGVADKGIYYCIITNPNLPLLQITTFSTTILLNGTSLNNYCAFAYDLTDSLNQCHDYFFFDVDLDVDDASCGFGADNVWFKFTARGPNALIYLNASTFPDMRLTLYEFGNSPCVSSAAHELVCSDIIDVNNLVIGKEYYLSVVGDGRMMHTFTLCINNSATQAPPANDLPCNARTMSPNVCMPGMTMFATADVSNPTCPDASNSIWYKTRLSSGMTALTIDLTNNLLFNNVSIMMGTFPNGCTGNFVPLSNAVFCERPDIYTIGGLQSGIDYYIQISTSPIGSGNLLLCLQELGRTVTCGINDNCNPGQGGSIDLPVFTDGGTSCYTGCTTGADPGTNQGDNSCYSFYNPTVWYSFTTDDKADFLTISITSDTLIRPYFALFKSTAGCQSMTNVYCKVEGSGRVDLVRADIEPNTRYFLAVSDFYGEEGYFRLCLNTYQNTSICNTDQHLVVTNTSLNSPLEGPYLPGEEVTFCYQVNAWQFIACNWLQGIVPDFGPCWDQASFDLVGQPRIINKYPSSYAAGSWRWFRAGEAIYNVNNPTYGLRTGDPLPAGWYFINAGTTPPGNPLDPNSSFGDGRRCALDTLTWEICFTLRAVNEANCSQRSNCNVSIKTFTDGEVGARSRAACLTDIPVYFNANMECCNNPEAFPLADITICSGDQVSVPLFANDTAAGFFVTPIGHPDIEGASSGYYEDTLRQTIRNLSDSIVSFRYTVVPEAAGCQGLPVQFTVSVYPSPGVAIDGDASICLSDTALVRFNFTGEPPFEAYFTANGVAQPFVFSTGPQFLLQVSPPNSTMYRLTSVTGGQGCRSGALDSVLIEVKPTSYVLVDTVICAGETYEHDGDILDTTGVYVYEYPGANLFGCDSTFEIRLTVGEIYAQTIDKRICAGQTFSVGNNNYDQTGTYIAVLNTVLGCDSIITLNLEVGAPLVITDQFIIDDNGSGNGVISINAGGGFPPYTFAWSNGATGSLLQNLEGGTYDLTLSDAIGCSATFSFEIRDLTPVQEVSLPGLTAAVRPVPSGAGMPVYLDVQSKAAQSVQLVLYDVSGRPLYRETLKLGVEDIRKPLNIPSKPGIYILEILPDSGGRRHLRLMVY